jgi:hypothetical protein
MNGKNCQISCFTVLGRGVSLANLLTALVIPQELERRHISSDARGSLTDNNMPSSTAHPGGSARAWMSPFVQERRGHRGRQLGPWESRDPLCRDWQGSRSEKTSFVMNSRPARVD